ncbi:MAG: hypothetical protein KF715_05535 [Candidatus Didemnitutus sp.]|nr:hypothetical protein [Candidatus Didemnitutus sp.]
MIDAMAICPVDRVAIWAEGSAGFGHFAQAFFPEDAFESQPHVDPAQRRLLVTDAYLDNRAELAAEFGWSNSEARAHADSAFVREAYDRWGEECPARLAGSFALAVWHPLERRFFAAVDHLGNRPFYFVRHASLFTFASTLRGVFALPEVSRQLNETAFACYVARIDFAPAETLYADVQRLSGGHRLSFQDGRLRIARYWNPDPDRVLRLKSDEEYVEAFRHEFTRATQNCLQRYSGRAAVLLSGGLDSSAVTAVAGGILARDGARLQAIHRRRAGSNRYGHTGRVLDESAFVEDLSASARDIDFHFLPGNSGAAPLASWDDLFEHNLVPFRSLPAGEDPAYSALLDSLDIGVILSGLGGNYLVSLENQPLGYLAHLATTGHLSTWLREVAGQRRVYGRSWGALVRHATLGRIWRGIFPYPKRGSDMSPWLSLLNPDLRARTGIDELTRAHLASWNTPPRNPRRRLHRILTEVATQQTGAAPSVVGSTRARRRSGAPMLDFRFNEFCLSLPFEQQIRDGWDRRLLRESMRGQLPDTVRLRVSRGQPQPDFQSHFAAQLRELQDTFSKLSGDPAVAGHLDCAWIARQWQDAALGLWQRELTLANSAALARFIRWHATWRVRPCATLDCGD